MNTRNIGTVGWESKMQLDALPYFCTGIVVLFPLLDFVPNFFHTKAANFM